MTLAKFKTVFNRVKPYLRWVVLAITVSFILHTLRVNWQQVLTLRFTTFAIAKLILALGITLVAHIWSGWVWCWIIRLLNTSVSSTWAIITYLKTNLGKYLPGNVWHFVGRIQFLRNAGASTGVAITSTVLEPVLMSVAALAIVLICLPFSPLKFLLLLGALAAVHPRQLNPILNRLARLKSSQADVAEAQLNIPKLHSYPFKPLLGEIGFVILRGLGFLLCFSSLSTLSLQNAWLLMGVFSLSWLFGLVIPGAPGGLGVFEATAIALLAPEFPSAIVLGAVALYRLNSTVAEVLGAALGILDERWNARLEHQSEEPSILLLQAPSDNRNGLHQ